MKLNKKKKGFTLIELMAVIAIVAILAAVLVPTVSGYIDRSKKTALITQVRNVVNAVEIYNSTAPETADIQPSTTIGKLIGPKDADTRELAFSKQELLTSGDVTKLDTGITYDTLKLINDDENAMNNIYKSKTEPNTGKFVYSIIVKESGKPDVSKEVLIEGTEE